MSNGTPAPAHPQGALRHRLSVDKLTATQLARVRRAFTKAAARNDNLGLSWWAGKHGVPDHYCQHAIESRHGQRFFLPWHRAYLYRFERALRQLEPDVTVPWWDWTFDPDHPRGIPTAYKRAKAPNGSVNPLVSQPIPRFPNLPGPPQPRRTVRANNPPDPDSMPSWEYVDKTLLNIKDYFTFSLELENWHGGIHGWVGGTMSIISWAAFDPIFWAHHVMIDRIWALWQDRNGLAGPTPDMFEEVLEPFNLRIPQVLDINRLGYTYAATAIRAGGNA